jgi:hypothetical protein
MELWKRGGGVYIGLSKSGGALLNGDMGNVEEKKQRSNVKFFNNNQ